MAGWCEQLRTSRLDPPLQITRTVDAHPNPHLDKAGSRLPIGPVIPRTEGGDLVWSENDRFIEVRVSLTRVPLHDVKVRWRTVEGTARAGVDFAHEEGLLTFPAGSRYQEYIRIEIFDDLESEPYETIQVHFIYPTRNLGWWSKEVKEVEITIVDDEAPIVVPFSVSVEAPEYLDGSVDVSIVGGVAHFAQPLPPIVGRGDRLEVEGLGPVFIDHCSNDSTCTIVNGRGLKPIDAFGVMAFSATAAFGSLAEAVRGASDSEHLGSTDLVAANRAIEFVCYGSAADTTPVVIDGWKTSENHLIRIVAADGSYGHGTSWRHPGRWSGSAYRVEVNGADCISSAVGHIKIEGLQLGCGARPYVSVAGVRIDDAAGGFEIAETLIMLDNTEGTAHRTGIAITSGERLDVVVRNSILWDLGKPGNSFQAGILVGGPEVSLWAANNTILGGGYGIHNLNGTVTAINNLVDGSRIASFEGDFERDSSRNLAFDGTAQDPPANAVGPVTMVNPAPGREADFHLCCGALDQAQVIRHDFEIEDEEELRAVFDADTGTLLRSRSVNPARVRLEFDGRRAVTGTSVVLSHHDSHEWMVAAAQSAADFEARTGSYRELVPWRSVEDPELAWDGVSFEAAEEFRVIELTVRRVGGDDYVHINEWALDGLNPACGQGVDLSTVAGFGFNRDVDSLVRSGAWDIGADQSNE